MLRWAVHLTSEMCHINHTQCTNDHLAEAPAEGNCCPPGTVICVDLQPQTHLASSAALMAVLLCHPPICSPQPKINSPCHRWSWKSLTVLWIELMWVLCIGPQNRRQGEGEKEVHGDNTLGEKRRGGGSLQGDEKVVCWNRPHSKLLGRP